MTPRDTRFDLYVECLATLARAPASADEARRAARAAHLHSVSFAARAEAEADAFAAAARSRIEESLASARDALASHGQAGLVPPRIRPSAVPKTATRADVESAIDGLRAATRALSRWAPPAPPTLVAPPTAAPATRVMYGSAPSREAQPQCGTHVIAAIGIAVVVIAAIAVFAVFAITR